MPFGTAEHPVNGPFSISLNMVVVEVFNKILSYVFANGIFYVFKVFLKNTLLQMLL